MTADARRDRVDQCRVVWYQWDTLIPTDGVQEWIPLDVIGEAGINGAKAYDISDYITSFSYTKGMANGAGSFSLALSNAIPWAKYMRAGTWIVVYLSGSGDLMQTPPTGADWRLISSTLDSWKAKASQFTRLITAAAPTPVATPDALGPGPDRAFHEQHQSDRRMVGVIQRVALHSTPGVDGALDIQYVVTGKDFGIALEETEIWFNLLNFDETIWTAVAELTKIDNRNVAALMQLYFDIFLNTDKVSQLSKALSDPNRIKHFQNVGKQWVLPTAMVSDLNLSATYFGQIPGVTEFYPTIFESNEPNPLQHMQGMVWQKLKDFSEPMFHELFTELSDNGLPKLIFRPIPWGMLDKGYPTISQFITPYSNLAAEGPLGTVSVRQLIADPIGTATSFIPASLSSLTSLVSSGVKPIIDGRKKHNVRIPTVEIESIDLGPAFHERFNFFTVDYSTSAGRITSALVSIQKQNPLLPYPFRNESDIKRHGFKPLHAEVKAFLQNKSTLNALATSLTGSASADTKAAPDVKFLLECAEVLRDYHQHAEDFYSGSLTIVGNREIKLGKVILTEADFPGFGEMVFYIQGYTDNFTIDSNGVGTWTQTLELIRGVEKGDLSTDVIGGIKRFTQSSNRSDNPSAHLGTFYKDRVTK